jgi:TolB-like protein/Tfp pilus assembly protein PilF
LIAPHDKLNRSVLNFERFQLNRTGLFRVDDTGRAEPVTLGSRGLDLLRLLAATPGEHVLKDQIIEEVWQGNSVEVSNLTVQISALRRVLDQDRAQGSCIQTIPGRGYRFIAAVTRSGDADEADLALPDMPSLAVLPFQNMSGDPEQEYFADGMVEEITTEVSRLPWLFVIARSSTFTYKGRAIDARQAARELGVRYVLEGSVRKANDWVRITGQLIDTATNTHIWAEHFDGKLDNIFDLQDRVASSVAGAIEPKLRRAEIARSARKPPDRRDAYDLYLRALAQTYRYTAEGFNEALALLHQALTRDPVYAPAAALVAHCHYFLRLQGWTKVSDADIAEDVRLARLALDAGRDDADTMWRAAFTLFFFANETSMAEAILDRALALNRNAAPAWQTRGWVHALRNQPDDGIRCLEQALRLSPLDPLGSFTAAGMAAAHLVARRFTQAIEWANRALHGQPQLATGLRIKMVANAHLGQRHEAACALGRLLAIDPHFTIAGWRAFSLSTAQEVQALYVDAFRLVGLPEE